MTNPRPTERFDVGLQHERTALAWERTAIAMMVSGVVFARYVVVAHAWLPFAAIGLVQTTLGSIVLVWSGAHYEDLHGLLRAGDSVLHPAMARTIGLATIALSGLALVAGAAAILS